MAKDKERTINPAAAQRKLEKQKALKKGKAAILAQRTSRLATRNPARLERQIADLKALEESGKLGPREKKALEDAERDLVRVRKARETLGDKGREGREGGGGARLGKRKREWGAKESEESEDTDESVRKIPMPRDTPPPIPRHAHKWQNNFPASTNGSNANLEPLGTGRGQILSSSSIPPHERQEHPLPPKPSVQTVYESKPIVRDLRKEAVEKFVPVAVKRKLDASKGRLGGRLLEEEEARKLEAEGYTLGGAVREDRGEKAGSAGLEADSSQGSSKNGDKALKGDEERRRLKDEEERFERELAMEEIDRDVRIEDVPDEDL